MVHAERTEQFGRAKRIMSAALAAGGLTDQMRKMTMLPS